MKGQLHTSYRLLKKYFHNVFALDVSTGYLTKQIRKVSQALKEPREILFVSEKADKLSSDYGKRLLRYVKSMFETIHRKSHLSGSCWQRSMHYHRDKFLQTARRSVPEDNTGQS